MSGSIPASSLRSQTAHAFWGNRSQRTRQPAPRRNPLNPLLRGAECATRRHPERRTTRRGDDAGFSDLQRRRSHRQEKGAIMANCRTLYASPEQSTLVCGPFGVVIWRGAATLAGINRVREMGLAALQSSPGGAVLFGVIEESAAMPDAEQRRRSAAVNDELAALGVV